MSIHVSTEIYVSYIRSSPTPSLTVHLRNNRDVQRYAAFKSTDKGPQLNLTAFTSDLITSIHYELPLAPLLILNSLRGFLSCIRPSARVSSCLTHRPRVTLRLCAAFRIPHSRGTSTNRGSSSLNDIMKTALFRNNLSTQPRHRTPHPQPTSSKYTFRRRTQARSDAERATVSVSPSSLVHQHLTAHRFHQSVQREDHPNP